MNFTKMDGQEGVDMRARHCFMKKQILTENPEHTSKIEKKLIVRGVCRRNVIRPELQSEDD